MADQQTTTPIPTQTHKNPWAITSGVLIVLLILGVGYYFWGQKYFSFGQKVASFADCQKAGGMMLLTYPEQCTYQGLTFTNPNQSAGAPPTSLKSYQSNQYGLELKYGSDFTVASSSEIATDAFTEKGDVLLADFALNKNLYKGTNLSSADILLSVAPSESETDCQKYTRPDRSTNLNTTKIYNNINFFYGQTGGAAAGTEVTNNVYHTFYNGKCYKINTVEFIADIGNFEPGAVKEFNKADVQAKFDAVLNTFKFTDQLDTSSWKIYENPTIGLSFQYPPDWTLNIDSNSVDPTTHGDILKNGKIYTSFSMAITGPNILPISLSHTYLDDDNKTIAAQMIAIGCSNTTNCLTSKNGVKYSREIVGDAEHGYDIVALVATGKYIMGFSTNISASSPTEFDNAANKEFVTTFNQILNSLSLK